ncbi:MAG: signal recognition particle protein Srp54 [Candidatus Hydrothermarchaeota archaeon]|nr:signal recognition particle protein Srp54 [Candidatus Hydrothermarchaeota archaeon]
MVLEKLSESLSSVVRKITLAGSVDERLIKEVVRDIQRALLSADVNVKIIMQLSKKIETRALKEKPKAGLGRREHVVRIVYEELVNLLGRAQDYQLLVKGRVMLVGLQGSGKTTTAVKLARFYQKRGARPYIIVSDTYRPAAYEQASQLAEPFGIKVYGDPGNKEPLDIMAKGMGEAKKSDLIILDSAGRHKKEDELFAEMKKLHSAFKPDEQLLVIDGTIGQQAGAQAKAFHEAIGVTGVILTKLDGSAKGGGALSAVAETGSSIRFIGTGERVDDVDVFDPDRFISRLLGMGDLQSLLEKAKESVEGEKVKDILKGEFTLLDLRAQIEAIGKLGPLSSVLKMIPGMSMSVPKEASQLTEVKMKKFMYVMDSMTMDEQRKPKVLNASRITRIAQGSGTTKEDVKELIKYYNVMKKALKGFKKRGFARGALGKMMQEFR